MEDTESNKEKLEHYIKAQLMQKGFTGKDIINNRGLINATIEEVALLVGIRSLGIVFKPK